jgi:hypothetical protein
VERTPAGSSQLDLITCAVGGRGDPCTQWLRQNGADAILRTLTGSETHAVPAVAMGLEFVFDSTKLREMAFAPFRVLYVSHGAWPGPAAHRGGDLIKIARFSPVAARHGTRVQSAV